jgi:hypothetical protein
MPCRAPRPRAADGRVVPVGQPVPIHAGGVSGEICLLSYPQQVSRGLLTMVARTHDPDVVFSFSWIEVIASGRSAQARAILPVRWQASRPAI